MPLFVKLCIFVLAFSVVPQCGAQIQAVSCPRGTFGLPDCRGTCHCLSGGDFCRWEDGRCTDGKCSFGWINPPTCQTACPHGSFGYNCSLLCHCPVDDVCDSVSGLCSSNHCQLGWGGPSCQKLLPVLVNPPVVTATTESQVTLSWPKWVSGQTGLGEGTVISHNIQQIDNVTNSWQNVVNLQDSSALMKFTYTVVNLRPNTAYKYRIQLVMDDSHKPLPSVPGPESPRWILTNCGKPSDPPTDVAAEVIENHQTYVRVTWTPPSLESTNCNGFARHEIFIACIRPCVNLTASEDWPANVSIIQYFRYTNYTINVTVRAINDAGLAGPLSVPFPIVAALAIMSSGVALTQPDITSVIAQTTAVTSLATDVTTGITTSVTAGVTSHVTTIRATVSNRLGEITTTVLPVVSTSSNSSEETIRSVSSVTEGVTVALTSNTLSDVRGVTVALTSNTLSDVRQSSGIVGGDEVTQMTHVSETQTTANTAPTTAASSVDVSRSLGLIARTEIRVMLQLAPYNFTGRPDSIYCEIDVEELDSGSTTPPPHVSKSCLPRGVFNVGGLVSATQYRITVNFGYIGGVFSKYPIVLYTAPLPPPSPPTPVITEVSDVSFKVYPKLATRKRKADIIFRRLVVIERLNSNVSLFQSVVADWSFLLYDSRTVSSPSKMLLNASEAALLKRPFYIAGLVSSGKDAFVVGDGQTYDGYSNVPLVPNSSYMVWYVWENSLDGFTRRMVSRPSQQVLTGPKREVPAASESGDGLSAAMIILIVLCVLLFFILFLILLIVLLWRRAKINRITKVEIVRAPYKHPEPSSVNRNLAVSYLNSFLIPRSAQKDFDAISGADGDYVIPDACLVYECSGSSTSRSCPIPVQKLRDFCSEYLLADSGCSLEEQFLLLPNCFTDSVNVAMLTCNAVHNRSAQVVPYDRNRVKLKHALPQSTTYINASFVRTIGRRYCVVTQCPTLSTLGHFWQMVWERGTNTIVMLMNSEAPDSLNFDCYWPEMSGRYHAYDSIHVELVSISTFANYSVRHFKIGQVNALRERHVFHWQYVSWSKGGVPEHPVPFLSFVKRIREERKSDAGFLVHCRTGGGRSGVYVAIDTLLTQGHNTGVVDVLRLVTLLRAERSNLVKSFAQYRFIYECLCEEFDHNPSRYLAERFVMTFEGLESSETALETLTHEQQVMAQVPVYIDSVTRSLVSRQGMLPVVCSSDPSVEEDDELNDLDPYPVQVMSGFVKRNMFIASRCPSVAYHDEFWHTIADNRVNCIVMLNKMADLPDAEHLLPQLGRSVNSKQFSILCTSVKAHSSNIYVAYNLKVRLRHFPDEVGAHNVRLFEFAEWPSDAEVPPVVVMLELLEQLRQWQRKYSANRPVLLFSACGSRKSRAALLMVLWYVLEQSEKEGVLDIFSTSRLIRSYIFSAIDRQDQYRFMYLAVRDYLKRSLDYYTLPKENENQLSLASRPGWTSPSNRHSTSASRTKSRRKRSFTSELPSESEVSPKASLEDQHQEDPLRRNLYHTDLEGAEKESEAVTDKAKSRRIMSARTAEEQVYVPEAEDVEKPALQPEYMSGFVSPPAEAQESELSIAPHDGQNSKPVSKTGASQSKSGRQSSVELRKQLTENSPRPRARGSSAGKTSSAKKTDAEEDQGDEAGAISHRSDSSPGPSQRNFAEYATVMKPRKSSGQRTQHNNSDSVQISRNVQIKATSSQKTK